MMSFGNFCQEVDQNLREREGNFIERIMQLLFDYNWKVCKLKRNHLVANLVHGQIQECFLFKLENCPLQKYVNIQDVDGEYENPQVRAFSFFLFFSLVKRQARLLQGPSSITRCSEEMVLDIFRPLAMISFSHFSSLRLRYGKLETQRK